MHGQRELYGLKNVSFFIYFTNSCERGLGLMNIHRSAAHPREVEVFKITDDKKCRCDKRQKK